MAIEVSCACGKQFRLKDKRAGKGFKCPACGQRVTVPRQEENEPEELSREETDMEIQSSKEKLVPQPTARKSSKAFFLGAALLLAAAGIGGYLLIFGNPFSPPGEAKDGKGKTVPARVPGKRSHGVLDVVDSNHITGWARDPEQPNHPVSVDILDNDKLLATVPADQFRKDLVKLGGSGKHRFLHRIPASLKDGQEHVIRVKISGTNIELRNSPKTVTLKAKQ